MDRSAERALDESARSILSHESELDDFATNYYRHQKKRLAQDLDILADHADPGTTKIVEIGSSPLFITVAMARLGYRVIGLDVEPERFASAIEAEGLDVRRVDLEVDTFPIDSASIDLVMMNEVFEHLRAPLHSVREIERILVPGGRLLLSTPNLRSFRGIVNLVVRGKGWAVGADPKVEHRKPELFGHMGHVREYTPVEVGDFLSSCGLVVERVIHRGALGPAPERLFYRAVPFARPFFTIVARKPLD